jgi:hypothetical protein
MVHHNRWVLSAADNDAGARLGREFRFLFGPFDRLFGKWFAARQTRRLPYLFSVAPAGFRIEGLPPERQPPSRDGFSPTHALLDQAFDRLIAILERLLAARPFVLGERFTLVDAALYGQLAMNLSDPSADRRIRERAPRLHAWLVRVASRRRFLLERAGTLRIDTDLSPLLAEDLPDARSADGPGVSRGLRALEGQANAASTSAFDRAAPYEGDRRAAARSVAKTFQAKVWRGGWRMARFRQCPGLESRRCCRRGTDRPGLDRASGAVHFDGEHLPLIHPYGVRLIGDGTLARASTKGASTLSSAGAIVFA